MCVRDISQLLLLRSLGRALVCHGRVQRAGRESENVVSTEIPQERERKEGRDTDTSRRFTKRADRAESIEREGEDERLMQPPLRREINIPHRRVIGPCQWAISISLRLVLLLLLFLFAQAQSPYRFASHIPRERIAIFA